MNLQELKGYFENNKYPEQFHLDDSTFIINSNIFVKSHIDYLTSNPGNILFIPYYNRLLLFYEKLTK